MMVLIVVPLVVVILVELVVVIAVPLVVVIIVVPLVVVVLVELVAVLAVPLLVVVVVVPLVVVVLVELVVVIAVPLLVVVVVVPLVGVLLHAFLMAPKESSAMNAFVLVRKVTLILEPAGTATSHAILRPARIVLGAILAPLLGLRFGVRGALVRAFRARDRHDHVPFVVVATPSVVQAHLA